MRLIIPLILIALMLPYATGEDEPTGEWLIPPDRPTGVVANSSAGAPDDPDDPDDPDAPDSHPTTRPATQPAADRAAVATAPP
jgi:hypothetical protein